MLRSVAPGWMLLAAPLVWACGGKDAVEVDAAIAPDATAVVPDATPRQAYDFVISAMDLPTNGAEAMALGFDLDGASGGDLSVDNQFGSVIGSLGALAPSLDQQAALTRSIDRGERVQLARIVAAGLTDAVDADVAFFVGTTTVTPAACLDAGDEVCRQHLAGTGMFTIDAAGPTAEPLAASIVAGTLTTTTPTAGTIHVPVGLFGATAVVALHRPQMILTGLAAAGWSSAGSRVGGAITMADVDAVVMPAIIEGVQTSFDTDCEVGGTPGSCNCTPGSTGVTLRNLFDKAPTQDCVISDPEVRTVVSGFLTPDLDLDGDGTNDAISLGLGLTAVAGRF